MYLIGSWFQNSNNLSPILRTAPYSAAAVAFRPSVFRAQFKCFLSQPLMASTSSIRTVAERWWGDRKFECGQERHPPKALLMLMSHPKGKSNLTLYTFLTLIRSTRCNQHVTLLLGPKNALRWCRAASCAVWLASSCKRVLKVHWGCMVTDRVRIECWGVGVGGYLATPTPMVCLYWEAPTCFSCPMETYCIVLYCTKQIL